MFEDSANAGCGRGAGGTLKVTIFNNHNGSVWVATDMIGDFAILFDTRDKVVVINVRKVDFCVVSGEIPN